MLRIVILLSGSTGRGSNMASLAQGCKSGMIPQSAVACVIGTHSLSPALERARRLNIPIKVVPGKSEDFDQKLFAAIKNCEPDLICLAGYMRKVPANVLVEYSGRIINIHPALLPKFGGKGMYGHHVHEAVIQSGEQISGCTVHFVDEDFDTGPIILQKTVQVHGDDTPESLAARVLEAEHQAYPEAVSLIAQGRVHQNGRTVTISPPGN